MSERLANCVISQVDYKARVEIQDWFVGVASWVADHPGVDDCVVAAIVKMTVNPRDRLVFGDVRLEI